MTWRENAATGAGGRQYRIVPAGESCKLVCTSGEVDREYAPKLGYLEAHAKCTEVANVFEEMMAGLERTHGKG